VSQDDNLPGPAPRSWGYSLEWLRKSPGARKEESKRRDYNRPRAVVSSARYAELHLASAFSFLDGASLPEDLVQRAVELELPAVALVDRNGVYGAPRFYKAAREAGIKALVGTEVEGEFGDRHLTHLTLLVAERAGYRNLCRLVTAAARDRPKGEARADWQLIESHQAGLWCLAGGSGDPLDRHLAAGDFEAADRTLGRLRGIFGGRLHVELQRHRLRDEEHRNQALIELARPARGQIALRRADLHS
jgi:error-prone DNA polymerase